MTDEPARITVNLTPDAVDALAVARGIDRFSKTDVVNRALRVYRFVVENLEAGNELVIRRVDGTTERVHLI